MTFNFSPVPEAAPAQKDAPRPLAEAVGDEKEKPRLRALLVGHPNVGKSVVFGALTGTYVAVSNYPGTTVEITRGTAHFGDRAWQIVDTPGTNAVLREHEALPCVNSLRPIVGYIQPAGKPVSL